MPRWRLKLADGTEAEWEGKDGPDAVRRYTDAMRVAGKVVAVVAHRRFPIDESPARVLGRGIIRGCDLAKVRAEALTAGWTVVYLRSNAGTALRLSRPDTKVVVDAIEWSHGLDGFRARVCREAGNGTRREVGLDVEDLAELRRLLADPETVPA